MASKDKIYMVMEFMSGGELFDKIVADGPLEEDVARRVFQQLLDALDYCHKRSIFHRSGQRPQHAVPSWFAAGPAVAAFLQGQVFWWAVAWTLQQQLVMPSVLLERRYRHPSINANSMFSSDGREWLVRRQCVAGAHRHGG